MPPQAIRKRAQELEQVTDRPVARAGVSAWPVQVEATVHLGAHEPGNGLRVEPLGERPDVHHKVRPRPFARHSADALGIGPVGDDADLPITEPVHEVR